MTETTTAPRLIPVLEAFSQHLRVSKSLGYKLIRQGRLHICKIGSNSYVTADEIRRFIAELPRGVQKA
ncbi:hypothetical protein V5F38_12155 [Xanthobacter sp. V0B-10]|uniref:hypothetical protein n=1 Tax=Xanthobacter albus TaxID=3119929 RepID=UPI00372CB51A